MIQEGERTFSFLFNADVVSPDANYGAEYDSAFLDAVSKADPGGDIRSCVLRGDILIHVLCEEVLAVAKAVKGSSHTVGHNRELFKTVVWDLVDCLMDQWASVDIELFPSILANQNVYCITVTHLVPEYAIRIDGFLHARVGYLGAFDVDVGNPVQKAPFLDFLIKDACLNGGFIMLELSPGGHLEAEFAGSEMFAPNGERRVATGQLGTYHQPLPTRALSPRGKVSQERYSQKSSLCISDRVLIALSRLPHASIEAKHYSFGRIAEPLDALEALLPENKFVQYLLNPNHDRGAGKAKFFREVLGIDAGDWRYLAAQLYGGLKAADLKQVRVKEWAGGFGASFDCIIPVRGRNGVVANLHTNWIMKPGLVPQLSTAFPGDSDKYGSVGPSILPIAVPTEAGDWEEIFNLASEHGEFAGENCLPTPVREQGGKVLMEGRSGYALVVLADRGSKFTKWILSSSDASAFKSDVVISMKWKTGSRDRALACAKAFAAVLTLNGIACSTRAVPD